MQSFAQELENLNKNAEWFDRPERGILNKTKELINKPKELFFSPELQEIMDDLRDKDDEVRSIIGGRAVGNSPEPDDNISLKDLLKSTKSNLNRREYMKAISELGRFHKRMHQVSQILSSVNTNIDKVHHQFLFKDMDPEAKEHLYNLHERVKATQYVVNNFMKEAGVKDFFHNLVTDRGRALKSWEKTYPKQAREIKNGAINLLRKAESFLTRALHALKELASARASRNVDMYAKHAAKIVSDYKNYDIAFKTYYNSNVKKFVEKEKEKDKSEETTTQVSNDVSPPVSEPHLMPLDQIEDKDLLKIISANSQLLKDLKQQGVKEDDFRIKQLKQWLAEADIRFRQRYVRDNSTAVVTQTPGSFRHFVPESSVKPIVTTTIHPQTPPPPPPPISKSKSVLRDTLPSVAPPDTERKPPSIALAPDTERDPNDTERRPPVFTHKTFFESLQVLANEDQIILAAHIKKYANKIKLTDPETSNKLFNIVKSIVG